MDKKGAVVRCPKRQGGVTPPNHNTCSVDIVYCIEKYCIPISEYKPYNHGGKPNPITAINNLYNLKPTVNNNSTEYFRDQQYINNSNSLYNTLKEVNIEHQDLVTIIGNPYIETLSRWNSIPQTKRTVISSEYPELPDLASMKKAWDISNNIKNLDKGTVEDATLDVINTVMFVKTVATKTVQGIYYGSKKLATNVANLFTSRPVVKTIIKNDAKLERLATKFPSTKGYANKIKHEEELSVLRNKYKSLISGQKKADKTEYLADGRIRYYMKERPAKTPGNIRGNREVVEYNPQNGNVRRWEESINHQGEAVRVHPKQINGVDFKNGEIPHYPPTAKDIETFGATK